MIRLWLRKWLGIEKGKILLLRKNGEIVQVFLPMGCDMDLTRINEKGAVISYRSEYGPIEIEDLK